MISVVIPALNEEKAILDTIRSVQSALEARGIAHEIIVVDDGSSDETGGIAKAAGARVIGHPTSGGYGRALKTGILAAVYDVVGILDADGTYPAARIPDLFDLVCFKGYDMAVGARTGKEYRGTFFKMPARRVFQWLGEYATGRNIPDINSGLRVFRRDVPLRFMHTVSNGFSFTASITLAALLSGCFVAYIPIDYGPRVGRSHVRAVRDSLRSLQIIVENILYYNPLKLFLLLCQMLGVIAIVGGLLWRFGGGNLSFGGAVLFSNAIVGAVVVAAIGFTTVRRGSVQSMGLTRELGFPRALAPGSAADGSLRPESRDGSPGAGNPAG